MSSNVTVLIAPAQRMAGVRAESPIAGPVLYYSDANLESAIESIRAHNPGVIAVESHFAETTSGRAFVDQLRLLSLPKSEIRVLDRANGAWSTAPLDGNPVVPEELPAGLNTRRAPRFLVLDPARTAIDGTVTSLVNISVLGAQVLSEPALRPSQVVKVTIVEQDAVLRFAARVAWATFEKPRASQAPHYRAGMEFDDETQQAFADFCRRHCSDDPVPFR